jgi:hypothetical protein
MVVRGGFPVHPLAMSSSPRRRWCLTPLTAEVSSCAILPLPHLTYSRFPLDLDYCFTVGTLFMRFLMWSSSHVEWECMSTLFIVNHIQEL